MSSFSKKRCAWHRKNDYKLQSFIYIKVKLAITTVSFSQCGKNGFAEESTNSVKYRSENKFRWTIKVIM